MQCVNIKLALYLRYVNILLCHAW